MPLLDHLNLFSLFALQLGAVIVEPTSILQRLLMVDFLLPFGVRPMKNLTLVCAMEIDKI